MLAKQIQEQTNNDQPTPLPLDKLLGGRRYAWISHGDETYLLQVTKSNKLLLTK